MAIDRRFFLATAASSFGLVSATDAKAKTCPEASDRVKFTLYRDGADEWRWQLFDKNSNLIAESGEGYVDKRDAERGIEIVKSAYAAPVNTLP